MDNQRITALLFDLGGTLHTVKRTEESRLRFCTHLIEIYCRTWMSKSELEDLSNYAGQSLT